MPSVTPAQLLALEDVLLIDLRSPAEHAHDHIPGAHNVPLFDDVERAIVGTLFRQVSPSAAFERGHEIVRQRIGELVARIAALAGSRVPDTDLGARVDALCSGGFTALERALVCVPGMLTQATQPSPSLQRTRATQTAEAGNPADAAARIIVVHCWRGGLRSRSVALLLAWLGMEHVYVLEGGHRAYRTEIVAAIEHWSAPPSYVLRGLTGVGKTLVLRELERLRPGWTLDLEGLAGHRSSLLGMVGLQPVSQKRFESRLHARIAEGFGPVLVIEGESRKVGDIVLPPNVWRTLSGAVDLELVAPLERRIAVLEHDYLADQASRAELRRQLPLVDARLVRKAGAESLVALFDAGRIDELVTLLLERYYDPLYRHSERGKHYAARIDASDPPRAALEIAAWIDAGTGARTHGEAQSLV